MNNKVKCETCGDDIEGSLEQDIDSDAEIICADCLKEIEAGELKELEMIMH